MIKFNELKIEDCNKSLIIDASVIDLPYYTDIYIESVTIDVNGSDGIKRTNNLTYKL